MKKDEFESNEAMRQRMLGISNDEKIHESKEVIRKGGFFTNVWYRYKWTIIITAVFLAIFVIVGVQIWKKDNNDMTLVYAGPKYINSEEYSSITEALKQIMNDYNGDGEKKLLFSSIVYQTAEQREENSIISDKANAESLDLFQNQIMSGEVAVYMLDPFFYEMYEDRFIKVKDILGYDPDTEIMCGENGVYLKKTEFAKYIGGLDDLPNDTVLCVMTKLVTTDQTLQNNSVEFFKAIVEFKAEN